MIRSGVDLYVLYTIVRRLAMPFTDWKAYKVGLIDDKGEFLVPKGKRNEDQEYVLTYLDIFVLNLKKLLQKIPGANNRFVTYAAALWLLREDKQDILNNLIEDEGSGPIANSSTNNIARVDQKEATAFKRFKTKKLTPPTK